ncbi:MAG: hypothetical protein ACXWDO_00885 [Bacteroidia bacterium]
MKIRYILFIVLSILMSQTAEAQHYYIKALGGYGFRIPGETYESTIDHKFSYYSLGKGFQIGGGIGYRFKNNLAFEMNLNYISSKDYKVSNYRDIHSNVLQLMPAFTLHHKISPKSTFASGFGPVIGIYTKMREVSDISVMKLYGGSLPIGAFGQLAYNYNFSGKFYAIAELRISALSYTPHKGEIISYKVNGEEGVETLPTNERFEIYDEIWRSGWDNRDPNQPSRYSFTSYNYSNVSLQIGFGYRFIKNEESTQNKKYKKKKRKKRR